MSDFEAEPLDVGAPFESADADIDFDALLANQEFAATAAEQAAAEPFDPFDPASVQAWQDARDQQLLDQIGAQLAPVTDAMTQRLAAQNLAASQAMQARQQQQFAADHEAGMRAIGESFTKTAEKLGGSFDTDRAFLAAEAEFSRLPAEQQTRENAQAIVQRQAEQAYRTRELEPVVDSLIAAESAGTGLDARVVKAYAEQVLPLVLKQGITGQKSVQLAIEVAKEYLNAPEATATADARRPSIAAKHISRWEAADTLTRLNKHIESPREPVKIDHADLRRPSLAQKYAERY